MGSGENLNINYTEEERILGLVVTVNIEAILHPIPIFEKIPQSTQVTMAKVSKSTAITWNVKGISTEIKNYVKYLKILHGSDRVYLRFV